MPRNKLSPLDIKVREDISTNLKRLSHDKTQQQISDETGIPVSTLSGYFAKRSTPNAGAVQKLADYFGIRKSDIDPRYGSAPQNLNLVAEFVKIPLLGAIACGDPILAEDNIERYLSEPADYCQLANCFTCKQRARAWSQRLRMDPWS